MDGTIASAPGVRRGADADHWGPPGARAHIPAGPRAPLADFERISPDYPAFLIRADAA